MSNVVIPNRDYNFFSDSLGARSSHRTKFVLSLAGIVVIALLVFGAYMFLDAVAEGIQSEIDANDRFLNSVDTREKIQVLNEKQQEAESLKHYYESMEGILAELNLLSTIGTKFLETLTATLPQDVFFESVSMTNNQLQIQGIASARPLIAEFLYNLESLGLFDEVHISNIGIVGDDEAQEYNFILSCSVKEVIEE